MNFINSFQRALSVLLEISICLTSLAPGFALPAGHFSPQSVAFYHNPNTGRFWTQDSYEGVGSDPASLHKYTYCGNNPDNAFDPSGHESIAELSISTGLWTVARGIFSATIGGLTGALTGGYDAILHGNVSNGEIAQAMRKGFIDGSVAGGFFGAVGGLGSVGQFGASSIGLIYSGVGFFAAYQSYLSGNDAAGNFEAGVSTIGAVFSAGGMVRALTESFTGFNAAYGVVSGSATRLGLSQVGDNEFISPGGLRYGFDPNFVNRFNHVLNHTVDDVLRVSDKHSVFDAGGADVFNIVDNAWAKVLSGSPDVVPSGPGYLGRMTYIVDMKGRVGYLGGRAGAAAGNPVLTKVRIVVESDGKSIVTAHPY